MHSLARGIDDEKLVMKVIRVMVCVCYVTVDRNVFHDASKDVAELKRVRNATFEFVLHEQIMQLKRYYGIADSFDDVCIAIWKKYVEKVEPASHDDVLDDVVASEYRPTATLGDATSMNVIDDAALQGGLLSLDALFSQPLTEGIMTQTPVEQVQDDAPAIPQPVMAEPVVNADELPLEPEPLVKLRALDLLGVLWLTCLWCRCPLLLSDLVVYVML